MSKKKYFKIIPFYSGYQSDVRIIQFQSVVTLGATSKVEDVPPGPKDTAIIMYTSGSTGTPKVYYF